MTPSTLKHLIIIATQKRDAHITKAQAFVRQLDIAINQGEPDPQLMQALLQAETTKITPHIIAAKIWGDLIQMLRWHAENNPADADARLNDWYLRRRFELQQMTGFSPSHLSNPMHRLVGDIERTTLYSLLPSIESILENAKKTGD